MNYNVMDTYNVSELRNILANYSFVGFIVSVLSIVALWKLFKKAGKPGWASIIPIYNIVVLFQIVNISPWLILLMLIPIVNFVVMLVLSIVVCSRLAKAYGKGTGFAIGLFFLYPIFILILGLGDSKYVGITK